MQGHVLASDSPYTMLLIPAPPLCALLHLPHHTCGLQMVQTPCTEQKDCTRYSPSSMLIGELLLNTLSGKPLMRTSCMMVAAAFKIVVSNQGMSVNPVMNSAYQECRPCRLHLMEQLFGPVVQIPLALVRNSLLTVLGHNT